MYQVRATNGHTRLGGAKFVDLLMNLVVQKLSGILLTFLLAFLYARASLFVFQ